MNGVIFLLNLAIKHLTVLSFFILFMLNLDLDLSWVLYFVHQILTLEIFFGKKISQVMKGAFLCRTCDSH